jgi:dTMP kinase
MGKKMAEKSGRLIVFEGIDGSGKTTVSKMVAAHMLEQGEEVVWLREPSDSRWGQKIRDLASHKDSIPIEEELHYFIEDRKWDVETNIKPALKQKKTVILDRYFFSTACYQGARGLNADEILAQNRQFAPEPDRVFIIDVDVDTALQRIRKNRETEVKLFEKREFLANVRQNYLSLRGDHIHLINGCQLSQDVLRDVLNILS